jgi:circadian clock protein KaiC
MATSDASAGIAKTSTGIQGLDNVMCGGYPRGRTSVLLGTSGSGKTLVGVSFIAAGVLGANESGIIISFEESFEQLSANVQSLGYDLPAMRDQGKLAVDHVVIDQPETTEIGPFNLDGLLVRIDAAVKQVGAKRVFLDGVQSILAGFEDRQSLRIAFRRLIEWLGERQLTTVMTSEATGASPAGTTTAEYAADCLLHLDHRVTDERSTRRIRIVKYRGSAHGTNEYPFMIATDGLHVLPITSLGLDYAASEESVSSGLAELDTMLGGKGYYRGSSILLSGMAGCGKTSIAACFAAAACEKGQKALFCSFEEGPQQICRNMKSIGLDLSRHMQAGLLDIKSVRPMQHGLENHLVSILQRFEENRPDMVVLDPISSLLSIGDEREVNATLCRLIDYFKENEATTLFTSLVDTSRIEAIETAGVSSIMDAWLMTGYSDRDQRRKRTIAVVKARGLAHCDHRHEYTISQQGIAIFPCQSQT